VPLREHATSAITVTGAIYPADIGRAELARCGGAQILWSHTICKEL